MVDALNDVSTDIGARCKKFISGLERRCAKLHVETKKLIEKHQASGGLRAKANAFPSGLKVRISPNQKANFRTPKQQADSLTKRSKTCWGAHMSDKARHINIKSDDVKEWQAGLSGFTADKWHKELFKGVFVMAMKDAGLVNWLDKPDWGEGDEFHLQLEGAYKRTAIAKKRELACVEEYLRLTRKKGKKKNVDFEKKPRHQKLLKKASKNTGIKLD
jgi:hypothetical protein